MGPVPGTIALFGCFLIMIIILAVLALIVVKALAESPWGVFTVCSTVPIALFMGIYMRFIRPGRVGEVSVIGIVLLVASIYFGGVIAHDPYWGPALTFKDTTITFALIGYAFVSALLPVTSGSTVTSFTGDSMDFGSTAESIRTKVPRRQGSLGRPSSRSSRFSK